MEVHMNNNIIRIDNIKEIEQMLLIIENLDEKNSLNSPKVLL